MSVLNLCHVPQTSRPRSVTLTEYDLNKLIDNAAKPAKKPRSQSVAAPNPPKKPENKQAQPKGEKPKGCILLVGRTELLMSLEVPANEDYIREKFVGWARKWDLSFATANVGAVENGSG